VKIIKVRKTKAKIPVIKDPLGRIVAIGNRERADNMDLSQFEETEIENAIFEARVRFDKKHFTGYSTYVWFETDCGMLLLMQNRGVLKLVRLICERKATVDPSGFIILKFTYSKSSYRHYINPVE